MEVGWHVDKCGDAEAAGIVISQYVDALLDLRQCCWTEAGHVEHDAHALHATGTIAVTAMRHAAYVVLHVVGSVSHALIVRHTLWMPAASFEKCDGHPGSRVAPLLQGRSSVWRMQLWLSCRHGQAAPEADARAAAAATAATALDIRVTFVSRPPAPHGRHQDLPATLRASIRHVAWLEAAWPILATPHQVLFEQFRGLHWIPLANCEESVVRVRCHPLAAQSRHRRRRH
mmetsp:Transcript_53636/g.138662  ORF Transcript_53636/g.138662 Transcript_53636/m.138662 type:complete len:230 (-) Transcript_53636:187-876(-)